MMKTSPIPPHPTGIVPNQPYSHANHSSAGGPSLPPPKPRAYSPMPNFPPPSGHPSQTAGKGLHQRTATKPTELADIEKRACEVINEEWAVSRLAEAIACVNNPALAKDKGIVVTVVLAGTTREVSVAPAEAGMSAQELAPYKEAASKALIAMQNKYQNWQQTTQQRYNQLKTRYSDAAKNTTHAVIEWDKFLQSVRENNKRLFRCELADGTVITIGESKAIDDTPSHKVKLSSH